MPNMGELLGNGEGEGGGEGEVEAGGEGCIGGTSRMIALSNATPTRVHNSLAYLAHSFGAIVQ
jgi:hypothetical protein